MHIKCYLSFLVIIGMIGGRDTHTCTSLVAPPPGHNIILPDQQLDDNCDAHCMSYTGQCGFQLYHYLSKTVPHFCVSSVEIIAPMGLSCPLFFRRHLFALKNPLVPPCVSYKVFHTTNAACIWRASGSRPPGRYSQRRTQIDGDLTQYGGF